MPGLADDDRGGRCPDPGGDEQRGATLYHYLSDQDVPFEYELGIGQMAALLFVLSAGSQGLYRLHAVLSPVRRIVVTLAITLLP